MRPLDIHKTNVPNIRLQFRYQTLLEERNMVLHHNKPHFYDYPGWALPLNVTSPPDVTIRFPNMPFSFDSMRYRSSSLELRQLGSPAVSKSTLSLKPINDKAHHPPIVVSSVVADFASKGFEDAVEKN